MSAMAQHVSVRPSLTYGAETPSRNCGLSNARQRHRLKADSLQ